MGRPEGIAPSRSIVLLAVLATGCVFNASRSVNESGTGGAGSNAGSDGGSSGSAGGGGNSGTPGCNPNGPACNNCKDDDGDGLIDAADPECISPLDNDEGTFATGIPG